MIGRFIRGPVGVFIDASNMLYSQHSLRWKIDYRKLLVYLKKECSPSLFRYYTGYVGAFEKQQAFLQKMESFGYTVIAKEVKHIRTEDEVIPKSNLDIELALDAYRLRDQYDALLLFSGDSDFAPLVDLLRLEHKSVVVCSTRGHVSRELIERSKYVDLKKLSEYISYE